MDRLFDFAMDVRIELSIELVIYFRRFYNLGFCGSYRREGNNRRIVIFVNVRLNFEFYEDV